MLNFLFILCSCNFFRYWDTRQAQPVHTQQLPERCYALTVLYPLMVVGTADRHLIIYNLQNPQVIRIIPLTKVEMSKLGRMDFIIKLFMLLL